MICQGNSRQRFGDHYLFGRQGGLAGDVTILWVTHFIRGIF